VNRLKEFFLALMDDEPGERLSLAAGRVSKIECARSGEFTAMGGKKVKFTPADLKGIAGNFAESKKLKIGHGAIQTDTPNAGEVLGLSYDEKRDRLVATIKPTDFLAGQNRSGAFERVSMELVPKGDCYSLDALSFLGAHDPAITELEPVALAAGEERVVLCCADESGEGTVDLAKNKQKTPPASMPGKIAAAAAEEKQMEDQKVLLAEREARIKQLEEDNKKLSESDVDRFLASDLVTKKIPLVILKAANLKRVLLAAAGLDKTTGKLMLATTDGKSEVESSIYEGLKTLLLSMPDKLSGVDKEVATADRAEDMDEAGVRMAGVTDESARLDFAARKEIQAAKVKGETITYIDAVRRVEMAGSK